MLAVDGQKQLGPVALYRQATDVASVCREIVLATSLDIQGRKYVRVEGWTSIAVAHGCVASISKVEEVRNGDQVLGVRAVAEIRRMSDGQFLLSGEGFVGRDEVIWYGGEGERYSKVKKAYEKHIYPKRDDFAIRAMAQTRAVSRVCRTAFSHVVVLIDKNLSTVPAEEVAPGVDTEGSTMPPPPEKVAEKAQEAPKPADKPVEVPRDEIIALREQYRGGKWQAVKIHFGKNAGSTLGELESKSLKWYIDDWQPKAFGRKGISDEDRHLRAALDVAGEEEQA